MARSQETNTSVVREGSVEQDDKTHAAIEEAPEGEAVRGKPGQDKAHVRRLLQ